MTIRISVARKILLVAGLPVLFQCILLAALLNFLKGTLQAEAQESRSREVIATAHAMLRDCSELVFGFYTHNQISTTKVTDDFEHLKQLTANDAAQQGNLENVDKHLTETRETLGNLFKTTGQHTPAKVYKAVSTKVIVDAYQSISKVAQRAQTERADIAAEMVGRQVGFSTLLLSGLVGNVLFATGLWIFFVKSTVQPLNRSIERSRKLEELRLAPIPTPTIVDEIHDFDLQLAAICQDIVESDKRERRLLDNVSDVVCMVSRQGKIISANPACQSVFHIPPSELAGKLISELTAPGDAGRCTSYFQSLTEAVTDCDFQMSLASGEQIETRWSGFFSPTDNLSFCIVRNVTEQRRVERMRLKLTESLSEAMRKPLLEMHRLMTKSLNPKPAHALSDRAKKEAEQALTNLDLLLRFVDSILDFQNFASGKLKLDVEAAQAASMVDSAIQLVAASAEVRNISLQSSANPSIAVQCDRNRIVQILVNLISNAVRHTPMGGEIIVDCRQGTDGATEFRVIDSGPGVPTAYKEQIFEPFERLSGNGAVGSAGLGLAICKLIVAAHNGSIGVSDRVDSKSRGSIFWFKLPA